ncbi:acetylglutamate kinase [Viridibacillus sp. FSL R5-0477]|uniref:Acetylglutamate kinase n=1 Tax=Viridibacillus arenosi FSL R5-213 TaxID=1227360 RepID=W4F1F3_9BACL|nr:MULTISPECIES: acetylglutamate kinase [Viridibacillus]ETT86289.1 acetylglutamate kinase [Viridibacillus arenosi FSL R5-213]OMC84810.1 acetylglutamate kinase [Viridibacillus sp. FSL H8-0123]OMC85846.1 acetylglutamate kinase [Viridibacillus sp. FSL H7-0596]OMC91858.1 acetylglutamate kinase [Viridibacillus arenosi]
MTTYKSMQHTDHKTIVIKLGGSMLKGLNAEFFENFKKMQQAGIDIIIVHGGGPAINQALKSANVETTTKNGIRVTSSKAVEIVQSTLIGKVNPVLTHQLNVAGIKALGLSGYDGSLFNCSFLDEKEYGYVGNIEAVNTELLKTLLAEKIIPVVSCFGATSDGIPLNINGDTVASKVALSMNADSLLLVTDTPGIKIEEEVQISVNPEQIKEWINSGDIYGGMIPKVQAAVDCLNEGIPTVQIVGSKLVGTTIQRKEVFA